MSGGHSALYVLGDEQTLDGAAEATRHLLLCEWSPHENVNYGEYYTCLRPDDVQLWLLENGRDIGDELVEPDVAEGTIMLRVDLSDDRREVLNQLAVLPGFRLVRHVEYHEAARPTIHLDI